MKRKTAEYLRKGLSEHGFVVDIATNGEDGLHLATTGDYTLIVLDVMMPDKDGWSVIHDLRRSGRETPVLFLTARNTVDDKVKGLKLGADDYMVKPFAFSELLARIRTILRRSPDRRPEIVRVADLEYKLTFSNIGRTGRARGSISPRRNSRSSGFWPPTPGRS